MLLLPSLVLSSTHAYRSQDMQALGLLSAQCLIDAVSTLAIA
jgi:hypothetical protein